MEEKIDVINQKFTPGSVLRFYKEKKFLHRACIFLGFDIVIYAEFKQGQWYKNKEIPEPQIKFASFSDIIQDVDFILETQFHYNPYNRENVLEKAIIINQKLNSVYDLASCNSEHIIYDLAIGYLISPFQNKNVFRKIQSKILFTISKLK